MEIMNQIIEIENKIQSILGDNENIVKKKYEKANTKIEKFRTYHKEKIEREKKKIAEEMNDEQNRKFNEIESEFYQKIQILKTEFAVNKDLWIEKIFNEIFFVPGAENEGEN